MIIAAKAANAHDFILSVGGYATFVSRLLCAQSLLHSRVPLAFTDIFSDWRWR
jgi:hypothetical protein